MPLNSGWLLPAEVLMCARFGSGNFYPFPFGWLDIIIFKLSKENFCYFLSLLNLTKYFWIGKSARSIHNMFLVVW